MSKKPLIQNRKLPEPLPFQTPGEEIANSILHGIGALLSIAGLILLVLRANGYLGGSGGGALAITTFCIYTASLIIMFIASTLYHAIQHEGAKRVFRVLDHSSIYLLIAGTYTPFSLVLIRGFWGWFLFGMEWALAITGITLHGVGNKKFKKIEVLLYILMGWAVVLQWPQVLAHISAISLLWLIAGGFFYTIGVYWYAQKIKRGTHVTWHVFVLAGAICHWWSVWFIS
ncbi:PAQR family membrane homeostasis protein TrhA [Gracilinema caldarium]|uniref:Channel protein, hemolysin III family n=1 Tax=Gracilinema caldarium (strain ATCC 51460 / DSM 7334 / H1) TaxID=744872 RepID=F8EZ12_GRAC1|nr:hemolysin III family protein [Gracilinema caldarium]AEJ19243.1 channel protein, hemolysin III family [Gracilinema caldarium DSM 7334]